MVCSDFAATLAPKPAGLIPATPRPALVASGKERTAADGPADGIKQPTEFAPDAGDVDQAEIRRGRSEGPIWRDIPGVQQMRNTSRPPSLGWLRARLQSHCARPASSRSPRWQPPAAAHASPAQVRGIQPQVQRARSFRMPTVRRSASICRSIASIASTSSASSSAARRLTCSPAILLWAAASSARTFFSVSGAFARLKRPMIKPLPAAGLQSRAASPNR